ncbi:hypothetical protein JCM1841_002685 [Sporobolomyces salmonicolor]
MFSRSYATSHALEQQRSSPAPSRAGSQPPASHPRSTRQIPAELLPPAAPSSDPFGPLEQLGRVAEEEVDLIGFDEPPAIDGEEEPAQMARPVPAPKEVAARPHGAEKKRLRPSELGLMLFPPSVRPNVTSQGSPRSKRLSLPLTSTSAVNLSAASSIPILSKRSSLAGLPSPKLHSAFKKTLSPINSQRRTLSLSTNSLSSSTSATSAFASARDGTLLAIPLAKQLQAVKQRNASLSKSLAQATSSHGAQLAKAAERIKQLEDLVAREKESKSTDAEGWEAEATRLAAELAALQAAQPPPGPATCGSEEELQAALSRALAAERALAFEASKKRRAKELTQKLRCELVNRRWKEKWEVELLEREERAWEIRVVELECELAGVKGELACEKAEREELEDALASQSKRLRALTASRQVLLDSFAASEHTIASLRSSLSQTQGALEEKEQEVLEMTAEVERVKNEAEMGDRKKGGLDEKQRKEEKGRREKLEAEVKDLKAQLRTAQIALVASEAAASAATAAAESAQSAFAALQQQHVIASPRTSSMAKPSRSDTRPKKRKAAERDEDDDDDDVEAVHTVSDAALTPPSPVRTARAQAKKPLPSSETTTRPPPSPARSVDHDHKMTDPSAAEEEESYQPVKSRSRSGPAPQEKLKLGGGKAKNDQDTIATKPRAKKARSPPAPELEPEQEPEPEQSEEQDAYVEEDEPAVEGEPTARPAAPAPAKAKKRKVGVLADKSANANSSTAAGVPLKVQKKKKDGKKSSLDVVEREEQDQDREPAKKKKRTLFGGAKKGFNWASIENADVNSLIPANLSPIKLNTNKMGSTGLGLGGGGGGGGKKGGSIFG